jgi:hypothetical protein
VWRCVATAKVSLSFGKEIPSFNINKELLNSLFQLYMDLLAAKEFRQVGETDMFCEELNNAMKDNVVKAYRLLPDLKSY